MEIRMMSLSKFSGGGGTPLRSTFLTPGTGTFTPLADTTWFHIIMIGAGGNGGSSSGGYYGTGSGTGYTGNGGRGGSAAAVTISWYKRDSVLGIPIASYGYITAASATLDSVWNTGTVGTQGQLAAKGGNNGNSGIGSNGWSSGQNPAGIATSGESSLFGSGGTGGGGVASGYGAGGGGGANGAYGYDTTGYNNGGGGSYGLIIVTEY